MERAAPRKTRNEASSEGPSPGWRALVQTWWAPLAALLGVVEIVMGVAIFFQGENWPGRIIGGLLLLPGSGGLTLLGLRTRPRARALGNALVLVGTLPWFGLFWMIVPPLVGLLVWVGVFTSGFGERRPIPDVA